MSGFSGSKTHSCGRRFAGSRSLKSLSSSYMNIIMTRLRIARQLIHCYRHFVLPAFVKAWLAGVVEIVLIRDNISFIAPEAFAWFFLHIILACSCLSRRRIKKLMRHSVDGDFLWQASQSVLPFSMSHKNAHFRASSAFLIHSTPRINE